METSGVIDKDCPFGALFQQIINEMKVSVKCVHLYPSSINKTCRWTIYKESIEQVHHVLHISSILWFCTEPVISTLFVPLYNTGYPVLIHSYPQ